MGKDKPPKEAAGKDKAGATNNASGKKGAEDKNATPAAGQGKGHKQRGAGTVITARPTITTNDGVVLKAHERLPSNLLHEYCQREKRPQPKYFPNPPGNRMTVLLEDPKNSKNDLRFSPAQSAESMNVARDFAALLGLFHFQSNLPLERRMPEPYSTTWSELLKASKPSAEAPSNSSKKEAPQAQKKAAAAEPEPPAPAKIEAAPAPTNYQKEPKMVKNVPLDKNTADWLCIACSSQNFAKLLNGTMRTKCFRCQTPKSENCTLVAPANAATQTGAGEVAMKKAPQAITNLRAENKFASKGEFEQQKLAERSERNRRLTFFDALKRANRPKTIHLTTELRNKLEQLLGLQSLKSSFASSSSFHFILEEIEEEGILSSEICDIPYYEQANMIQEILLKLESAGYSKNQLLSTMKELVSNTSTFEEEYVISVSSREDNDSSLSSDQSSQTFSVMMENYLRTVKSNNNNNNKLLSGSDENEDEEDNQEQLMKSSEIGGAYFGFILEQLHHYGWMKMDSNNIEKLLEFFSTNGEINDENEARGLSLILHSTLSLLLPSSDKGNLLSLLQPILPEQKEEGNIALESSIEEEIAVLESIYSSNFSSCFIHLQEKKFYLFSLALPEHYSIHRISCQFQLLILIPCHIHYPDEHLPFVGIYLQKPTTINMKLSKVLVQLNHEISEKLFSLKGNLVGYELYSWLQERLSQSFESNFPSSFASNPTVNNGEIRDLIDLLKEGRLHEISSLSSAKLAEKVITNENPSSQLDDLESVQSDLTANTTNLTISKAESSSGKKESTPATNNKGGFWNPPRKNQNNNRNSATTLPAEIFPTRMTLPAWNSKGQFLEYLANHPAVIVTGETGCGKTTQIPQFIHELALESKMVICQPRRLAAIGVANRVAEEQFTSIGEKVGYMVKGDSRVSAKTKIVFLTYGVLLRRLQEDPSLDAIDYIILDEIHERGIDSDFTLALLMNAMKRRPSLKLILMSATISTSHFQQYLKKQLQYSKEIPILEIPGFTYPVTEFYKADYEELVRNYPLSSSSSSNNEDNDGDYDGYDDNDDYRGKKSNNYNMIPFQKKDIDYDLLVKLVLTLINPSRLPPPLPSTSEEAKNNSLSSSSELFQKAEGCILIFLPGVPEINRFIKFFQTYYSSKDNPTNPIIHLISLHSNVSPEDQLKIFKTYPKNHLKIIVSTNIAEASVTIPDVTIVIDCCRVKEMDFNIDIQAYSLVMKFASKDSLRQRKGRAGRVKKGRCYRLITKGTYEKLPANSIPEILRLPLESVLLQILSMNISISSKDVQLPPSSSSSSSSSLWTQIPLACQYIFLKCPDIPKEENILVALQLLISLQAIPTNYLQNNNNNNNGNPARLLTSLGELIARLPCHPRIGKLLVYGCLLDCVYPITCVAAAITCRSPFIMSNDPSIQQKVNAAKKLFSAGQLKSDYTIIINILYQLEKSRDHRRFCQENGLAYERIQEIKVTIRDYLEDLYEIGLIPHTNQRIYLQQQQQSSSTRQYNLLSAIYCAGLYPQLSKILRPPKKFMEVMGAALEKDTDAKEMKFYIPKTAAATAAAGEDGKGDNKSGYSSNSNQTAEFDILTQNLQRVFIHPSSVNFSNTGYSSSNYLLYGEKQLAQFNNNNNNNKGGAGNSNNSNEKIYLKDTSEVTSFALLLFGGSLSYDASRGLLLIDNWISFACSQRIATIFMKIREEFDRLLHDKLDQQQSIASTSIATGEKTNKNDLLSVVKELLETSII